MVNSAFPRDENFVPITQLGFTQSKEITYVAGTTGAVGATTLFDVTGLVGVRVFGVVSNANLTGSGLIEVGISGNTASLIAQTTGTNLDIGEIWTDNGPSTVEALPSLSILDGTDIIQTISSDTITAGTITYYCLWFPISSDGNVTAN